MFLGLACKGKLLTNLERWRRRLFVSPLCSRCGADEESTLHVLRDFSQARNLWFRIVPSKCLSTFFSLSLNEWLRQNLTNKLDISWDGHWACFFGIVVWRLGFFQNQFIFDGIQRNGDILEDIRGRVHEVIHAANALNVVSTSNNKAERWISWSMPKDGVMKLNTDGAFSFATGDARAGGLLRDSDSRWRGEFGYNIGHCSVTKAELLAVYHGLLLT